MIKTYYISVLARANVLTSRVPILNPLGGIRSIDQRMWLFEGYPSSNWVTRWNRYPVLWTNRYSVSGMAFEVSIEEDIVNLLVAQHTLTQLNV